MAGYKSILKRTVLALPKNTVAARMAVYQRARQSLIKQLNSDELQLTESQAIAVYEELENAIHEVEAESGELNGETAEAKPAGSVGESANHPKATGNARRMHVGTGGQVHSGVSEFSGKRGWIEYADSVAARSYRQGKVAFRKTLALISIALMLGFIGIGYLQWDRISTRFGLEQKLADFLAAVGISWTYENDSSHSASQTVKQLSAENTSTGTDESPRTPVIGDFINSNGGLFSDNPGVETASIVLMDDANGQVEVKEGGVSWYLLQERVQSDKQKSANVALARFDSEETQLDAYFRPRFDAGSSDAFQIDLHINRSDAILKSKIVGIPTIDLQYSDESTYDSLPRSSELISNNHVRLIFSSESHTCNFSLLKESRVIEIPIRLSDGRRAVIRLEKGEAGEKSIGSMHGEWLANATETFNQCSVFQWNTGGSTGENSKYLGNAVWQTGLDAASKGSNFPKLVADVSIEEIGLSAFISMNPVIDSQLDANHFVEIEFEFSEGFQGLDIAEISEIRMKQYRGSPGDSLEVKTSTKVLDNSFWIVLSPLPKNEKENLTLLSERNWVELLIRLENGGHAAVLFEKGRLGREVVKSTLQSWQESGLIPKR